jgi:hypothetical protein
VGILSFFMSRRERIKRKSTVASITEPLAHLCVVIVAILALPMVPFLFVIWAHHRLRTDADHQWNELMRSGPARDELEEGSDLEIA